MIRRLTISGFKSLVGVTVELHPVTVLIGKSGSGKTNFVQALRFLRNYLLDGQRMFQAQGDWGKLLFAPAPVEIFFDIEFSVPAVEHVYRYVLRFGNRQNRGIERVQEELYLGQGSLFSFDGMNVHRRPDLPDLSEPNRHESVLSQLVSASGDVAVAHAALTSGIGCYDFPPTVLMAQSSSARLESRDLDDQAESYLWVYATIASDLHSLSSKKNIVAALRKIDPTIDSLELDSIHAPKRMAVSHRVGERRLVLDLSQESYGLRRFLAHLLAIHQVPAKQCLLFEEPENGIYPSALSVLAEEFQSAPASKRGQVILTTHSPGLLDHFRHDQIRVVEITDFKTVIGPISKEQREALSDRSLVPGELLTVDEARIDPVPLG